MFKRYSEKPIFSIEMGCIYLISEYDNDSHCKIGRTSRSANSRVNELQTGNMQELYIRHTFKTEKPSVLERMIHNHYSKNSVHGEWFELTEEECRDFPNVCRHYQDIIDSLRENPFF